MKIKLPIVPVVFLFISMVVLGATNQVGAMNQPQIENPMNLQPAANNGGGSSVDIQYSMAISTLNSANNSPDPRVAKFSSNEETRDGRSYTERSYVEIGKPVASLNSLATPPAEVMISAATVAFSANALEESKVINIANDRSVMLASSMVVTSMFSGREDRLQ